MNTTERKRHWENIFSTKNTTQVSWYQPVPETSLRIIENLALPKSAKIIDAGCGDSCLPDHLLKHGYTNITLVDISEKALEATKKRLGENAQLLCFAAADVTTFTSEKKFDCWHDRAVFHFLNEENDIQNYLETVTRNIQPSGYLVVGTFSDVGPNQCSGLHVKQYTHDEMINTFSPYFETLKCFTENHHTPSGGIQNFRFGVFKRKS